MIGEHATQPLEADRLEEVGESEVADEPTLEQQSQSDWEVLANHPFVKALKEAAEQQQRHIHGPFDCLLNQNHNALRWCTSCGATWVGVMAGASEADLQWHIVQEPPSEEEGEL